MQWNTFSIFFNFFNVFKRENGGRPLPPTPVSSSTPQNRPLPQIWGNFKGILWGDGSLLNYIKNMGVHYNMEYIKTKF